MRSSRNILLLSIVLLTGIFQINTQYTAGDFNPSNTVGLGIKSPVRMAIDSNDQLYVKDVIQKNNQLFAGGIGTGNSYKVVPI